MDKPTKPVHGYDLDDLDAAAEAIEMFGDDELERYASMFKRRIKEDMPERTYYSIISAAQNNIKYLRDPIWKNPCDHIEVLKLNEGPDARVVAIIGHFPMNMYVYNKDPIDILVGATPIDVPIFHEYTGPLSGSEAYVNQQRLILTENKRQLN